VDCYQNEEPIDFEFYKRVTRGRLDGQKLYKEGIQERLSFLKETDEVSKDD